MVPFSQSVEYSVVHCHSLTLCERRLPRGLIELGAGGCQVRLLQSILFGHELPAYRSAQRFGRPEEPGRPLGFSFGRGYASKPFHIGEGNHLLAQFFAQREAFFVSDLSLLVITSIQRRPPQIDQDVREVACVSMLPEQCRSFPA